MEEEKMQKLRSKATELLLREEWRESEQAYSHFISLCQDQISQQQEQETHQNPDPNHLSKLQKTLCLAFSNRAESRIRLRDFVLALQDCEEALRIENTHFKTLICKGKILLNLCRYGSALECFKLALLDPQACLNSETLNGYVAKCKKLEFLSKTGSLDLSDWVLSGFVGKSPEFAEFIGSVEIKKSEVSGRGLFATKNIEIGALLFITKAIATERGILPKSDENAQLAMWKNFIDRVVKCATKCRRTHHLISTLSTGEDEGSLEVPDLSLFKPETEDSEFIDESLDTGKILCALDVNSLVEDSNSGKVLGKFRNYYGVGLWLLASFVNHSCSPNARRLHIGDHVIVYASRDVKAGEEITFAYFDVLSPLNTRDSKARTWGFRCNCKRCKFEGGLCTKQGLREIEMALERGGDLGEVVYRLEEGMGRWVVRGKEKGYLRASFWGAFSEVFLLEKALRRWGRRVPALEVVADSVADVVGGDERVLKVMMEGLKRNGGGGLVEMDKVMKMGRGMYGKIVKKQAMRTLLEQLQR